MIEKKVALEKNYVMTKAFLKTFIAVIIGLLIAVSPSNAQKKKIDLKKGKSLLNKVKKMTEPEKKSSSTITLPVDNTEVNNSGPNERKLEPPDVSKEISNAQMAFNDHSYTEARFYIQQAIVGIELEIGHKILNEFPEEVMSINADKSRDVVYSTGAGFTGMEVSRQYVGDEGSIKAIIANSSVLGYSQYAVSSMAGSSYEENTKITRYKGYKTVLEVDDYEGYKMSVPFGQISIFMLECDVCQNEEELLKTADLFDIEKFKNLLGEK